MCHLCYVGASVETVGNIRERYCCSELEGCLESMKSDLVLEDLAGFHPGFNPVCLQKWSLRLATAKFKQRANNSIGKTEVEKG